MSAPRTRRHWHANHVDAPARGSQKDALKDARRLGVPIGPQYASIVLCYRAECTGNEHRA